MAINQKNKLLSKDDITNVVVFTVFFMNRWMRLFIFMSQFVEKLYIWMVYSSHEPIQGASSSYACEELQSKILYYNGYKYRGPQISSLMNCFKMFLQVIHLWAYVVANFTLNCFFFSWTNSRCLFMWPFCKQL